MEKRYLRRLSIDIEFWCDSVGYEWSKTAKHPFCFLVLDPVKKQYSIKRWGFKKRPFGVEAIFWQPIRIGHPTTYAREIYSILTVWDEHWTDLKYNGLANELPPKPYINSIRDLKESNHITPQRIETNRLWIMH